MTSCSRRRIAAAITAAPIAVAPWKLSRKLLPPRRKFAAAFLDVRILPKQRSRAPDHLHHGGVGGKRQRICDIARRKFILVAQFYLDELARPQRVVERADDGGRESLLPDVNGRIEMVCLRSQLGALPTFQFLILP